MAEDKRLVLARLALEQGDRFQARDQLSSLLKEDPENTEYWLLMSTVVESNKERIYCLKKVLALDPRNPDARLGMILFGAETPERVRPAQIKKQDWLQELPDLRKRERGKKSKQKSRYNYKQLTPLAIGAVVIVMFVMLSGIIPGTRSIFSPRLTITPITSTPTADPGLVNPLTGTPDPILQVPIGQVLDHTYTPTPPYALTPHPGYGSYQTALRAYQTSDFETMLTYMRQTAEQLETPDIVYLVGEALRNMNRYHEALEAYDRALFLDPAFAPAYYGRALANLVLDPGYDIKGDLDQALLLDPSFGQIYLERAKYYLAEGSYQLAYADASQAVELLPGSPLAYYYQAEALLGLKDYPEAEKAINQALLRDINHVPSYLVAGRVSMENGKPERAIELLTRYDPYDPDKGWEFYYALGKSYYLTGGDLDQSLDLLDLAIAQGGGSSDVWLTKALVHEAAGNLEEAVREAFTAQSRDREDFDANLELSRLLYLNGRFSLGLVYVNIAQGLVRDEFEQAEVYYYQALLLEQVGRFEDAIQTWEALLGLPREYVPDEWEFTAEEKLLPTATPTQTLTFTPSATFTPSQTASQTPSPTLTPTPALTPTP